MLAITPKQLFIFYIFCNIFCKAQKRYSCNDLYDYIIVGGGTAGTILANRLTVNPKINVLVLEAGKEEDNKIIVPALATSLQLSEFDWAYKTVPQENSCFGHNERRSNWPRGKILGGSSSINSLLFIRGCEEDFDNWERIGAVGWSWDDVFPYFLKSENNQDDFIRDNGYHGTNGELPISRTNYYTPLAQAYVDAAKELNYKEGDFNGPDPESFMVIQGTIKNGERWSADRAFLHPISKRKNLHIVLEAFVHEIIFDKSNRATGVKYYHMHKNRTVTAKIEVIVAAGAINSPQLLMLSGIGPREHLESFKIPVRSDLPVGKNLQDHFGTLIPFVVDKPVTLKSSPVTDPLVSFSYYTFRQGPLSSMGAEAAGLLSTKYNNKTNWPDIELVFSSATPGSSEKNIRGVTEEFQKTVFEPYNDNHSVGCLVLVMRPESRGDIKLISNNPYDYPSIHPKYYSEPQDLNVLVEGMKVCLAIMSTKVMQEFGTRPFNVTYPGCEKYTFFSDDYMKCMAQTYTLTSYHPSGTCKMGNELDSSTVVDPELRVKGVSNLRVVDASIMPIINSGHTQAPVMMIAEKASDMILADYYKYIHHRKKERKKF